MAEPAVALTEEQVLGSLITRGYEDAFVSTPLRDFWGVLKSFTGEMRSGQSGSYMVVLYNIGTPEEPIEIMPNGTTEPYTSSIAQIDVPASSKAKSKMGYLGASIDKIINAGLAPDVTHQAGAKNQEFLKGKRLHWQFTPGHMVPRQVSGQWEDVPISCWVVTEVAGVATPTPVPTPGTPAVAAPVAAPTQGPSASQQALNLLDSKNVEQWHQVVFSDPIVKQDVSILNSFIDGSFLTGVETAGKITKDENGIYHKVG